MDSSVYAILDSKTWFPDHYLEHVTQVEAAGKFPFQSESVFLFRDFDQFDLRKFEVKTNEDINIIFGFLDQMKKHFENFLKYDHSKQKIILAFAEIRVSSRATKYQTPHYDEATNDFVVITPLTRNRGTIFWDDQAGLWERARPVPPHSFFRLQSARSPPFIWQPKIRLAQW